MPVDFNLHLPFAMPTYALILQLYDHLLTLDLEVSDRTFKEIWRLIRRDLIGRAYLVLEMEPDQSFVLDSAVLSVLRYAVDTSL